MSADREELELARAERFLAAVWRAALRRAHELARAREELGTATGPMRSALAAMHRSVALVGEAAEVALEGEADAAGRLP